MADDYRGERIRTLIKTMSEITDIYNLASETGIRSIHFLNSPTILWNNKGRDWDTQLRLIVPVV